MRGSGRSIARGGVRAWVGIFRKIFGWTRPPMFLRRKILCRGNAVLSVNNLPKERSRRTSSPRPRPPRAPRCCRLLVNQEFPTRGKPFGRSSFVQTQSEGGSTLMLPNQRQNLVIIAKLKRYHGPGWSYFLASKKMKRQRNALSDYHPIVMLALRISRDSNGRAR